MTERFDMLAYAYDKGRKRFPDRVIDRCLANLSGIHPWVLDLGCGTGIATEQLAQRGARTVGCDPSSEMIRVAQSKTFGNPRYVLGRAEQLPFPDEKFPLITAFRSFHWFGNGTAVSKIKRVLAQKGTFCSVSCSDIVKPLLEEVLQRRFRDEMTDFKPFELLWAAGFELHHDVFRDTCLFTREEFTCYAQSVRYWAQVSDEERPEVLRQLESFFDRNSTDGILRRDIRIVVLTAGK